MPTHMFGCAAFLAGLSLMHALQAANGPAKPTHILHPVILEVAASRPDGNAWDSGIGAFTRPDPQVTLLRDDARAQQAAAELVTQAMERRMKELGRPIDPRAREFLARNSIQSLRCGAAVTAMQDQAVNDARSKFAADTTVASDTVLAKIVDGGLPVASGDKVSIYVNDIDLAAHDSMGETELEITKELIAKGEFELKFKSVESLRFKLLPIK